METGCARAVRTDSPSYAQARRILEEMKVRRSATAPATHQSVQPPTRWTSRLAAFLCLCAILLSSCAQPQLAATPAPVVLHLAGSTSMQPLLRDLAAAYSERYPYVSFDFAEMGSTAGLEELRRGNADLALASRELAPEEELNAQSGERLLSYTVIAMDGIVLIVNESNPLRSLGQYELRKVFTAQVMDWADLGSPAGEITVVSREDGSATREVFEELMMNGRPVTPMAIIMPGSQAVRDYVAEHQGAIGYVSIGYLGQGVSALAIEGVQPTRETIEDGTYPLTRPFLLVTLPNPSSAVIAFMQFAQSSAARAIVKQSYGLSPAK
jgi:phosphate transport system substrate-binding protein